MLNTKSRTTLVAAIAVIGVLGTAGITHAVTVKGSTTEVMAHLNKPKNDLDVRFRSDGAKSVVRVIDDAEVSAHATASATGEGASPAACQEHARLINTRVNQIIAILIGLSSGQGDYESAKAETRKMVQEIEETLDDGCFIAYEEGPPPDDNPK